MDPTLLVQFLTPFLPHLLTLGKTATEKATESAAKKFGEATWTQAQTLWSKLSPKITAKEAAQEAITDLAQHPDNPAFQTVLEVQLQKLLTQDPAWAAEIAKIMAEVTPPAPTITVSGNHNQVIGQNFGTATNTTEQPQMRSILPPRDVGNIPLDQLQATVQGIHVIPERNGWDVLKLGPERLQTHFETQQAAVEFAQELNEQEQVKVFIHSEAELQRMKHKN